MFENLNSSLEKALNKIKGYGKITEANIEEVIHDIRIALLEADVNYDVIKEFLNAVKTKALGQEVQASLKPSEAFVKILNDELVTLLGSKEEPLNLKGNPATLMLVGLQGSGKTTTAGKLALFLRKKEHKQPLLVACDLQRPAAIEQLKQIGQELDIPVYSETEQNPTTISLHAIAYAKANHYDYVIIDTAGRLHIDEPLMNELKSLNDAIKPDEVLLVIDAMMGQDAIKVITDFNQYLPISGAILTKMDGDTRGGVALSLRHLTNIPIKMIGTSEHMDGLEPFYPDRMASRILGMGDLKTMVEHATEVIDEKEAEATAKKLQKGQFDLNDFLTSFKQIEKLGPLDNLIKMIPGANKMGLKQVQINPKDISHIEAIIEAMTPYERKHPESLKASHKLRIAKGSGQRVEDVNRLLKQFDQTKAMMKQMKQKNGLF